MSYQDKIKEINENIEQSKLKLSTVAVEHIKKALEDLSLQDEPVYIESGFYDYKETEEKRLFVDRVYDRKGFETRYSIVSNESSPYENDGHYELILRIPVGERSAINSKIEDIHNNLRTSFTEISELKKNEEKLIQLEKAISMKEDLEKQIKELQEELS